MACFCSSQHALPEYFKYSAYICKRERTFRSCIRLAFSTDHKIDRRVPKIVGQIEAISRGEIETKRDLSDLERKRLQGLLESKLERTKGVSVIRGIKSLKFFFSHRLSRRLNPRQAGQAI